MEKAAIILTSRQAHECTYLLVIVIFFFIRFFYLSFLYIFLIFSGTKSNGGRIYCDNIVLMKNQVSNPGSSQTLSNEYWHGGYF